MSKLPPNSPPSEASPSSASSSHTADRLGLAGLAVLPIPSCDTAAAVRRLAQEHFERLRTDVSTQDTLIFYGATNAHVEAIENDKNDCPGRLTFFGEKQAGLLFLRMVTLVHEQAHLSLFLRCFWSKVFRMGLEDACVAVGATRYHNNDARKEGDSGIKPDPPRCHANHFPSLVIEAGNSESLPRLYKDKDWWFENSGGHQGDVVVVLLVKLYRRTKRIVVEHWYRHDQEPSQTMVISPHPDKPYSLDLQNWQSHWVVNGQIVVRFEDVFLRRPEAGVEEDFVLTEQDVKKWAIQCWRGESEIEA